MVNSELVKEIAIKIIKTGIKPTVPNEESYKKNCRVLIDQFKADYNNPTIKIIVEQILYNSPLNFNNEDVLAIIAQIKKLYIDDYM